MTFALAASFTTTPGSTLIIPSAIAANNNFVVVNTDLAEDDVRQWGTLLLNIYIPDPVFEYATIIGHNCYNRAEVLFNPVPSLGSLNLEIGFYAGSRSIPQAVQLWTESV